MFNQYALQTRVLHFVSYFFSASMGHGAKPWVSDFNDPNYIAGRKAMKTGIADKYTCMISIDAVRSIVVMQFSQKWNL